MQKRKNWVSLGDVACAGDAPGSASKYNEQYSECKWKILFLSKTVLKELSFCDTVPSLEEPYVDNGRVEVDKLKQK